MKPPQRQTGQGIWFIDLLLFCKIQVDLVSDRKGQILRSTPNTAPLICGAYNTQPEGLSTMA